MDFESKLNVNTRAYYCMKTADRWLSVRLELLGALIGALAAFFATFSVMSRDATPTGAGASGSGFAGSADDGFASKAGLSLTYAIGVTGLLNWCVRSFAQLEAAMNSCERVIHYM